MITVLKTRNWYYIIVTYREFFLTLIDICAGFGVDELAPKIFDDFSRLADIFERKFFGRNRIFLRRLRLGDLALELRDFRRFLLDIPLQSSFPLVLHAGLHLGSKGRTILTFIFRKGSF